MSSSSFLTGKINLRSQYGANTLSQRKKENYGFVAIVTQPKLFHIRGR